MTENYKVTNINYEMINILKILFRKSWNCKLIKKIIDLEIYAIAKL